MRPNQSLGCAKKYTTMDLHDIFIYSFDLIAGLAFLGAIADFLLAGAWVRWYFSHGPRAFRLRAPIKAETISMLERTGLDPVIPKPNYPKLTSTQLFHNEFGLREVYFPFNWEYVGVTYAYVKLNPETNEISLDTILKLFPLMFIAASFIFALFVTIESSYGYIAFAFPLILFAVGYASYLHQSERLRAVFKALSNPNGGAT